MAHFRCSIQLFIVLMTSSLTSSFAAVPLSLGHASYSDVKQLFQVQLPGMVKTPTTPRQNTLHVLQQHRDRQHIVHTRMQQYYSGVPVLGGYAIIHATESAHQLLQPNTSPKSMNGVIYKNLSDDLGDQPQNFIQNGQKALQEFKKQFPHHEVSEEQVRPMIYIDKEQRAHWAYEISLFITHDAHIPERPTVILDANTLLPYAQWDDVKHAKIPVKGQGYGGNTRSGLHHYGKELPLLDLMRDNYSGQCYLENDLVQVVNMAHRYRGYNSTMRFSCRNEHQQTDGSYWMGQQEDGYDLANGAYSPTNDALFFASTIAKMYKNWYGFDVLTKNDKPMKMVMRVHFGRGFENAFWDGRQMTYGDGDSILYPLVSLGISAHEISHGFTEQHANLMYFGQSGGINESFSDMAAQAAEFYLYGKADWNIGTEVLKEDSGLEAIRYMDRPSRDGKSIDRADQYHDFLNVHYTSGVYNRLFYLLATQPNWDVRKAFQVMLTANADYWTPTSTFDEAACGVIQAAQQFQYSVDDVKFVLDQVAINYTDC